MTVLSEIKNLKGERGVAICAKIPELDLNRLDAFCRALGKPRSRVMVLSIRRLMKQAADEEMAEELAKLKRA